MSTPPLSEEEFDAFTKAGIVLYNWAYDQPKPAGSYSLNYVVVDDAAYFVYEDRHGDTCSLTYTDVQDVPAYEQRERDKWQARQDALRAASVNHRRSQYEALRREFERKP